MDYASLFLSLVGTTVSIWAICNAKSAKRMVRRVIEKTNEDEDLDRIQDLVKVCRDATSVVSNWESGVSSYRSGGRRQQNDLQKLGEAINELRTRAPISWSANNPAWMEKAVDDMELALSNINLANPAIDGWKQARVTLQDLIPQLEVEARQLRNRALGL